MDWIQHYQLFLFDFDGVLADTEKLHFLAYKRVCENRNLVLDWDEHQYAQFATFCANGLKRELTRKYPHLLDQWDDFYAEKKRVYTEILHEVGTELMPGVADLLEKLHKMQIPRCVVTHSPSDHLNVIKKQHPILQTIPNWVTRENYSEPKPNPECYRLAISRYAKKGDKIIGFEDSPRGLEALTRTDATAYLVTTLLEKEALEKLGRTMQFEHVPSFLSLGTKRS